ncbi:Zinc finger protein [Lachnellula willkommii]|uniref:Zinc finger protein n=1 Tax=Lachnellula willkommii TaxID=215461 RepID=A0A559MIQ1_9HELO|nr:Zinc finger protein [Lachnellula willkommii]
MDPSNPANRSNSNTSAPQVLVVDSTDSTPISASKASRQPPAAPGTQAELFACDQCPKVFNRRENLSRHQKTHDASPAHRCKQCSKAFTRSDLLKRHEAGHDRWDKKKGSQKSENESAKRRKFVSDESVESSTSSPSASGSTHNATNPQTNYSPAPLYQHVDTGHSNPTVSHTDSHYYENTGPAFESNPTPAYQTFETPQQFAYRPAGPWWPPNTDHQEPHSVQQNYSKGPSDAFENFNMHDSPAMNFDFSSFMVPAGGPGASDWFSYDFYSAVRETGNEWDYMQGPLLDPALPEQAKDYQPDHLDSNQGIHSAQVSGQRDSDMEHEAPQHDSGEEDLAENRVITRISSPPNEASDDDIWPFHWNPNAQQILMADPINIPDSHPLFKSHSSKFDITEQTLVKVREFLLAPSGLGFRQSRITLPSLPVVNVFIRLFFEHFSPQMPVLHHPTIDTNVDLPAPLIAVMVVIGAIYSNLKHSRRFSIVLWDIVRWNLHIAIECDNGLMRDNMIIYAEALICHTGLWCGNKRCFELAEVVRGALITYIRRVHFHGTPRAPSVDARMEGTVQADWKRWIFEESQRRLYWVIYSIDCQFPCLLNLPGTISISEVSHLICPADDEFWLATSARDWRNLLGLALVPPSRLFSAAVAPFILKASTGGADTFGLLVEQLRRTNLGRGQNQGLLDLNSWSAFLVLMAIQTQLYNFQQELMLARSFMEDVDVYATKRDGGDAMEDTISNMRKLQGIRRGELAELLYSWSKAYLTPSRSNLHPSSRHFYASSLVIHHLSNILLDVALSDLQNAVGRTGHEGMMQAMAKLTNWAQKSPRVAEEVAYNAVRAIVSLAPTRSVYEDDIRNTDIAPYSIITLFLSHLVLWVFAKVCPREQKSVLLGMVGDNEVLRSSAFFVVLQQAMALDERVAGTRNSKDAPNILFKFGAEMLTRVGTWGVALNLALMIHQRAEMYQRAAEM